MMELTVTRTHFNEVCTLGVLTVTPEYDFHAPIYTLEDVDRRLSQTDTIDHIKSVKVYGKTAIPYGRYEVAITYSERFKRALPLIIGVPGFDGIRIHPGNTDADTHGCLLVGYQKDAIHNQILQSRPAFAELLMLIQDRIKTEKIYINFIKL